MNPQIDSLAHMEPAEVRGLVVALLARLGGNVTLTEKERYDAYRDTRAVQVIMSDLGYARVVLVSSDVIVTDCEGKTGT